MPSLDDIFQQLALPSLPSPKKIKFNSTFAQTFKPHPLNKVLYSHSPEDAEEHDEMVEGLKLTMQHSQQIQPIIVNSDGTILSGHLRWEALKAASLNHPQGVEREISVVKVDLKKDEQIKLLLLSNQSRQKTPFQMLMEVEQWMKILKYQDSWGVRSELRKKLCEIVGITSLRNLEKLQSMVKLLGRLYELKKQDRVKEILVEIRDASIDKMDTVRRRLEKELELLEVVDEAYIMKATRAELERLCEINLLEIGMEDFPDAENPLQAFREAVAVELGFSLEDEDFEEPLEEELKNYEPSDWLWYAKVKGIDISEEEANSFETPSLLGMEVLRRNGRNDILLDEETLALAPLEDLQLFYKMQKGSTEDMPVSYDELLEEVAAMAHLNPKKVLKLAHPKDIDSYFKTYRNLPITGARAKVDRTKRGLILSIDVGQNAELAKKLLKLLAKST